MSTQIQLHERASYSYCARSWHQQTNPSRKNFPSGWKCYKTIIGSYVSCVFINIWSIWEVWRALKKLELLSAMPQATLTHLLCSPNFPHASYLDERMLTYELIVNCSVTSIERAYNISLACEPFNPLTPKILLVILLIISHIVLVMLVWRIWYWIIL